MTLKLKQLDHFPTELLALPVEKLHEFLEGPTLIHVDGQKKPALLVCLLLHGNEPSGYLAIQELMKKYFSRVITP